MNFLRALFSSWSFVECCQCGDSGNCSCREDTPPFALLEARPTTSLADQYQTFCEENPSDPNAKVFDL